MRGFRFWVGLSAALHVGALLFLILDMLPRRLPEPELQALEVEIIMPVPPQQAQGDVPAPTPAPSPVPAPPRPDQVAEAPRPQPVAPPLPPPPPPPAPLQAAAPPQPQRPTPPTPPPPPPAPSAAPTPPRPPQVAQTNTPPPPPPAPPRPSPAPPRPTPPSPAPPAPQPAQEAGTGQTPPVQRPQERSQSVLNTLDRLRAAQAQQTPPAARPNPTGAPAQGGGTPQGTANLTAAERSGLADRIGECWSVDAGAPGIQNIVVELRVETDAGGTVRRVTGTPPGDVRARAVYEAARRALLDPRCNPLPLPPARLAALRDTLFRFNPRDLGLR